MIQKTTFKIRKMDCLSEEQIIRMKLEGLTNLQSLEFDIPNRLLYAYHTGEHRVIFQQLEELNFDTEIEENTSVENFQPSEKQHNERKILWTVLTINFAFFVIEACAGFIVEKQK